MYNPILVWSIYFQCHKSGKSKWTLGDISNSAIYFSKLQISQGTNALFPSSALQNFSLPSQAIGIANNAIPPKQPRWYSIPAYNHFRINVDGSVRWSLFNLSWPASEARHWFQYGQAIVPRFAFGISMPLQAYRCMAWSDIQDPLGGDIQNRTYFVFSKHHA